MKRITGHLSYANVAATLALLFALSGGALAATGGFSSGGTLRACVNEGGGLRLLKPGKHCRRGLQSVAWNVTGRAGRTGAAGTKGVAGAQGTQGATGKEGKNGATNVVMRQGPATVVTDGSFASATASCNPGERATGGGLFNEDNVFFPRIVASEPTPNSSKNPPTGDGQVPTGWKVWVAMSDVGAEKAPTSVTVFAYVICAAP